MSATDPFPRAGGRPIRPRRWDTALVVAAGGCIGGGMRYLVNHLVPASGFPWATFVENVVGCFLLAALLVVLLEVIRPHRYVRPFLGVGILGGFTTFSTYTSDTRTLLSRGEVLPGLAYLFGSVAAGLVAVALGMYLTRLVTRTTPSTTQEEQ